MAPKPGAETMKMLTRFVKFALFVGAIIAADHAIFESAALAAPAKGTPLKTDAEIAKFLTKCIEEDKSFPDHEFAKMLKQAEAPLEIKRQDDAAMTGPFKRYFKKHELWLVTDKTLYIPGPAFAWLLALDRETPRAFLLGTNRSQEFAKNMAALFAAEKVAPKDEKEALELGDLVVSLVRYSSYMEAKVRKDVPNAVLRKWTEVQIAKFTDPGVKKEKGFRVTYPVHEVFKYPPFSNTLIIYEIEFPDGGEMNLKSTRIAVGK
jgi:hypothetical protein